MAKKTTSVIQKLNGNEKLIAQIKAVDSLIDNFNQNQFTALELGNTALVNFDIPLPKIVGITTIKKPLLIKQVKNNS
jgi:hypothetical protein